MRAVAGAMRTVISATRRVWFLFIILSLFSSEPAPGVGKDMPLALKITLLLFRNIGKTQVCPSAIRARQSNAYNYVRPEHSSIAFYLQAAFDRARRLNDKRHRPRVV